MAPNPADRFVRYSRDRDVDRTRRLRTGLVSAGVIGSLGMAGWVGYTAASASTSSGSSGASRAGSTFNVPKTQTQVSHGDDGGQGDDGSGAFGNGGQAPPPVQQGSGGLPQGQTAGS